MARLIAGDRNAYLYLGTSISAFRIEANWLMSLLQLAFLKLLLSHDLFHRIPTYGCEERLILFDWLRNFSIS